MLASTKQFIELLDAKGTKYTMGTPTKSGKDTMTISYRGDNMDSIRCNLFFDTDCESVALRVFDIVKVPEGKLASMFSVVNGLNNRFRFAKFCIDTDDNTIQAEIDGAFRSQDAGEVSRELLLRIINICDEAYPDLMKALWA